VDLVRIREILITCLILNRNSVRTRSLVRPGSKRGDHKVGIRETGCKNV
jgi:hypothetical protein